MFYPAQHEDLFHSFRQPVDGFKDILGSGFVVYQFCDAAGLDAFKQDVAADVARHNMQCPGQVKLFDFLGPNALTTETMVNGSMPDYVDLVHVRPPAGLWLLRQMGVTGP